MPEPKLIVVVDKLPNGKLYCMEFTPEQLEKYRKMQNDSPRARSINGMFFKA